MNIFHISEQTNNSEEGNLSIESFELIKYPEIPLNRVKCQCPL